jgi:adenosylhomocysteine nucleosidase
MTTELDNSWIDSTNISKKITIGIIGTADKDLNYETAQLLRKEKVLVVDWESGAITKICDLNKVKCLVLRGISDKPVSPEKADREKQTKDYRQNTYSVMERLITLLPAIIKSMIGKFDNV